MAVTESRKLTLFGLVGAGATGGITATIANSLIKGGVGAGDLLQFLGGMLGAGLAVAGALFVESVKRTQQDRDQVAFLRKAIAEFERQVTELVTDDDTDEAPALMHHLLEMQTAFEAMTIVLEQTPSRVLGNLKAINSSAWLIREFKDRTSLIGEVRDRYIKGGEIKASYNSLMAINDVYVERANRLAEALPH